MSGGADEKRAKGEGLTGTAPQEQEKRGKREVEEVQADRNFYKCIVLSSDDISILFPDPF